jgi:hypothetical protein
MKAKQILLILAISLIGSAIKAPASIGWSRDECVQHWGKPVTSTVEGRTGDLKFNYQTFLIQVMLENDRVIAVEYLTAGMTDQDLNAIRLANGKDWTFMAFRDGRQYWTANDLFFVTSGTVQRLRSNIDIAMIMYRKDIQRLARILGAKAVDLPVDWSVDLSKDRTPEEAASIMKIESWGWKYLGKHSSLNGKSVRWEFSGIETRNGIPVIIDVVEFVTPDQFDAARIAAEAEAENVYNWLMLGGSVR